MAPAAEIGFFAEDQWVMAARGGNCFDSADRLIIPFC
jgi:hypothetical protein